MKITAIIEQGDDGMYSVYSEQTIGSHGLGGFGETIDEAKADFMLSIDEALGLSGQQTGHHHIAEARVTVEYKQGRTLCFA